MPGTAKPGWVEALDSAKSALGKAVDGCPADKCDALTRVAYAWIDIARLLKGDVSTPTM